MMSRTLLARIERGERVLEDDLHARRRDCARLRARRAAMSSPSKRMRPAVALTRPMQREARSSTCRNRIRRRGPASRRARARRSTPSTAFTVPTCRCSTPSRIGKWTFRSSTERSGLRVVSHTAELPAGGEMARAAFPRRAAARCGSARSRPDSAARTRSPAAGSRSAGRCRGCRPAAPSAPCRAEIAPISPFV